MVPLEVESVSGDSRRLRGSGYRRRKRGSGDKRRQDGCSTPAGVDLRSRSNSQVGDGPNSGPVAPCGRLGASRSIGLTTLPEVPACPTREGGSGVEAINLATLKGHRTHELFGLLLVWPGTWFAPEAT